VGPRADLDRYGKSRPSTGIRSQGGPFRGESLYQLHYPGTLCSTVERWTLVRGKRICVTELKKMFLALIIPSRWVQFFFLWLCSPARAIASCGSAAQRGLWPPVALQPSAGYGLLSLCSPARAMASCGSAAQRRLWHPVALQLSAGYGLLLHEVS
jgi:hypothetical protein